MFNPLQFSDIDLTSLYKSLNPRINPNPNLFFPQPILPSESQSSEHVLNPPVNYPHGLNGPDLPIYGGFEQKTSIRDDPNEDYRIQVVEQLDSDTHGNASSSLNENPTVTTSLHAPENNIVVNDITKIVPQKTVTIQSIRCEICDIECNSSVIYERHLLGRRHKKKSAMCISPTTTSSGAPKMSACENLEMKRQKLVEGNAKVFFMRFCIMCNAVCNSQEMFEQHLAGKNHAKQARKHTHDGMVSSSVAANPIYISGTGVKTLPQTGLCESDPNNTSAVKATHCEVCDIYCTSNDGLMAHIAGKKHLKIVKKLRDAVMTETGTPAPVDAPITEILVSKPMEEGEFDALKDKNVVESRTLVEDSDKKKRKILQTGADGIAPSSVSGISTLVLPENNKIGASNYSLCEVCNISCTCDDDLTQHRLGKKHFKNLAKMKIEKKPEANHGEVDEKEPRDDSGMKKRKIVDSVFGSSSTVLPRENQNGNCEINPIIINTGPFDIANPGPVFGNSAIIKPQDNKEYVFESNPNEIIKFITGRFGRCEVCDIFCTSNDILNLHKLGKNHLKKMEKLKNTEIWSMDILDAKHGESYNVENKNAENSVILTEDLERKKRKMMEVGADREDVRVCTVCSVVCYSQSDMDCHLNGKKHAKMMRKRAANIYMATVGPQHVAAT